MEFKFNAQKVMRKEKSCERNRSLKYKTDISGVLVNLLFSGIFLLLFMICVIITLAGMNSKASLAILSAALFFISIIKSFSHLAGKNYRSIERICQALGISMENVEKDCENSLSFTTYFGDDPEIVILGNRYFITRKSIIPAETISWIFYRYKTFRANNSNYIRKVITVCLTSGAVNEYFIREKQSAAFLNEAERLYPNVVLGYSPELEKLYMSERGRFKEAAQNIRPMSKYEVKKDEL